LLRPPSHIHTQPSMGQFWGRWLWTVMTNHLSPGEPCPGESFLMDVQLKRFLSKQNAPAEAALTSPVQRPNSRCCWLAHLLAHPFKGPTAICSCLFQRLSQNCSSCTRDRQRHHMVRWEDETWGLCSDVGQQILTNLHLAGCCNNREGKFPFQKFLPAVGKTHLPWKQTGSPPWRCLVGRMWRQ
jgi:hypothetical protein